MCDYVPSDPEPEPVPDFTTDVEASFTEPDSESWADSDPEDEEPPVPDMPP